MGGEEATGRPAGGAGQHPKGRNVEKVSAARALRPGAAGLEGSVAHPIDGERNDQCDRAGAALADLRKTGKTTIRAAEWPNGAPALLRHADRHLAGTRPVRGSVGAQRR